MKRMKVNLQFAKEYTINNYLEINEEDGTTAEKTKKQKKELSYDDEENADEKAIRENEKGRSEKRGAPFNS